MNPKFRRDGTKSARILRDLGAAPGGTLPTTAFIYITEQPAERYPDPATRRQRALVRAGSELRDCEAAGLVERAGQVPGHWQQAPVSRWRITDNGRQQIAWWDDAPDRTAALAEAARLRLQRRAQAKILLEHARQTYAGRQGRMAVSRAERIPIVSQLREHGCTLQEIADVFGLTREAIRLDTLPVVSYTRNPRQPGGRIITGLRGRRPVWLTRLEDGMLAGMAEVTFTEW